MTVSEFENKQKEKEKKQEREELDEKLRLARYERYACQSVARMALPRERISICLRAVKRSVSGVEVWKHIETKKAFYKGLMICASVWNCPVCAAKISEKRRKELQQAFDTHKSQGGYIALLTLTFKHQKVDRLNDILQRFGKATDRFMSGRNYQKIRDKMGLIGRVRALEVTYGKNGFHPHAHVALFYTNEVDLSKIKNEMYPLWEKACAKVDLEINQHGLMLDNGAKANEYIAKHGTWGLDQEMTKGHIKKAKDGLTPFDFLRKYIEEEDEKYLNLFREYAQCFKGKRQLQWSQGLKKQFILEEKTDEELAQEQTERADILGTLDYQFWKRILKYEHRSKFLDLCEKHDFEKAVNIMKDSIEEFEVAMKKEKPLKVDETLKALEEFHSYISLNKII